MFCLPFKGCKYLQTKGWLIQSEVILQHVDRKRVTPGVKSPLFEIVVVALLYRTSVFLECVLFSIFLLPDLNSFNKPVNSTYFNFILYGDVFKIWFMNIPLKRSESSPENWIRASPLGVPLHCEYRKKTLFSPFDVDIFLSFRLLHVDYNNTRFINKTVICLNKLI